MSKNKKETRKLITNTDGVYLYKFYDDKITIDFRVDGEPYSELSVLKFITDSYKNCCLELLAKFEHYNFHDLEKKNIHLASFYLPAMFCFRHYIELKLKYLYAHYYKESFLMNSDGHKLKKLLEDLQKRYNNKFGIFNKAIEWIDNHEKIKPLEDSIDSYFRYLADKEFNFESHLEISITEIKEWIENIGELEFRLEQIKQNDWLSDCLREDK